MKIVSIDIGHTNMGLLQAKVYDKKISEILLVKVIDLFKTGETEIYKKMKIFIDEYSPIFNESKYILIERQPLQGLTSIQEIIAYTFPEKVVLISPRSMHCYFGISYLDYSDRKSKTIEIANTYLNNFPDYINSRKHDLADALCILLYYINKIMLTSKDIDFNEFKYNEKIEDILKYAYVSNKVISRNI